MRLAALAVATACLFLVGSFPADAQSDRARTRIIVKKRSYLDAGTTIKPGTGKYHDYAFPVQSMYPSYGPFYAGNESRFPLPRAFDVPGY